ncbi:telomerase RNA component interacting RNase-like [Portunus trituberculatus]|uniref:telomerase RNA component interacting RNase-like n=1 Tax=Portunus trituberculatus TaxID=210409 RepID=UPI001E1CB61F|nr:telomerase RNA component interacting RNase-like [Portunus trituberculatus]
MADVGSQQYSSSDSREDSNSQDDSKQQTTNVFRNDGSFMEMFKKMQEEQRKKQEDPKVAGAGSGSGSAAGGDPPHTDPPRKPTLSFVGKRRGGRILATGMVKKQRREAVSEEPKPVEGGKTDAWSQYMSEVRKYKEQSCEEEGKRRPLVK